MATKNPYDLLGVSKTATDKEIRSAYRKLAKTLHPDVNKGDEAQAERFKEVTAAYNLLTNEELRAQYDSGRVDANGQQQNPFAGRGGNSQTYSTGFGGFEGFRSGPGGHDDMSELFGSLFGMNMGGMRGGMHRPPMRRKGEDIRYTVTLSLPESLKGGTRQLPGGTKVRFPKGVKSGQTLRVRGKGQPGINGGPAGDAKVAITVSDHENLRREGDDLHLRLPISLTEAVSGGRVRVDMPTGSVSIKIAPGSNTGKRMRLKGKGVNGNGNLLLELVIVMTPDELNRADMIADLLGGAGEYDSDSSTNTGQILRRDLIGS